MISQNYNCRYKALTNTTMDKYWMRLLKEWRTSGRTGLTIPYILGSQKYLPAEHETQSISDLLRDIGENTSTPLFLKYCMDVNDLILQTIIASNTNVIGFYPTYRSLPQTGLFVSEVSRTERTTIEKIIMSLEERYQVYIDRQEYSVNNGQRGDFTLTEKAFIYSCYHIYF